MKKLSSHDAWGRYQDALRKGDKAAAAAAFKEWQQQRKDEGKVNSKPTLVSLGTGIEGYPNAIPVDQIPDEMERNPEFFELMRRIVK